jgi:SCF-associated factor 1
VWGKQPRQPFIHSTIHTFTGKLDSEGIINNYGDLGDRAHCQRTPATLVLPVSITSIRSEMLTQGFPILYLTPSTSAGRRHLLCLDAKHQVWLFASWGRPALIVSSQIQDSTSRTSRVVQVEAGWDMIAVLTEAGHVLVEWPFHGEFHAQIVQHHDVMIGQDTRLSDGNDVLHCATWEIHKDFLELPALPNNLPVLDRPAVANADSEEELRAVKIAAGEGFVVVLTNQGHVLKMDITHTESLDELRQNLRNGWKNWIYVRHLGPFPRLCTL